MYVNIYNYIYIYHPMLAKESHRTSGSSDRTSNRRHPTAMVGFLNFKPMFLVWQGGRPQLKLGRSSEHRFIVSHQHGSSFRNCPHGPSPFILEMPFSYLRSLRQTPEYCDCRWHLTVATCSNHSQRGPSLAALIFSRVDAKSNTCNTDPETYGLWHPMGGGKLNHASNFVMPSPGSKSDTHKWTHMKTLVPVVMQSLVATWWRLE